jgi:hypothetical protein
VSFPFLSFFLTLGFSPYLTPLFPAFPLSLSLVGDGREVCAEVQVGHHGNTTATTANQHHHHHHHYDHSVTGVTTITHSPLPLPPLKSPLPPFSPFSFSLLLDRFF